MTSLVLSTLLFTACPGPTKPTESETKESGPTTSTTTNGVHDQDVGFGLSTSLEQPVCKFTNPDASNIIANAGSTEELVSIQAFALALKWENDGSATLSGTDLFQKACDAVVEDLNAPTYPAPPLGDCPGLYDGRYISAKPVAASSTMNGALERLTSIPGFWCQVTLKDPSKPENLIWAMMFAFKNFRTPAMVNWDVMPTLITSARVRVPALAAPQFQLLMNGTNSAQDLVDNYPGVGAAILELNYFQNGSQGSLVNASGDPLTVAQVQSLFSIPGTSYGGSAIIDPVDAANIELLDNFLASVGDNFLGDACDGTADTGGGGGTVGTDKFDPEEAGYSEAETACGR